MVGDEECRVSSPIHHSPFTISYGDKVGERSRLTNVRQAGTRTPQLSLCHVLSTSIRQMVSSSEFRVRVSFLTRNPKLETRNFFRSLPTRSLRPSGQRSVHRA